MQRRTVWVAVVAAVCGLTAAIAQDEGDKAAIRELWDRGASLYQRGCPVGAIRFWREAVKADSGNAPIQEKIDRVLGELVVYKLASVVDATTIVLSAEDKELTVHLLGVGLGDTVPPNVDAAAANEATLAGLKELTDGQAIYLCGAERRLARDGSATCNVFLTTEFNSLPVELVRRGLLRPSRGKVLLTPQLEAAQTEARAAGVGLWKGYRPMPAGTPAPRRVQGRLLVPLRQTAEWFGAKLQVMEDGRLIVASKEFAIVGHLGSAEARINGRLRTLDFPLTQQGDNVFVPVQMIAGAAKAEAVSNLATGEVILTGGGAWTMLP